MSDSACAPARSGSLVSARSLRESTCMCAMNEVDAGRDREEVLQEEGDGRGGGQQL